MAEATPNPKSMKFVLDGGEVLGSGTKTGCSEIGRAISASPDVRCHENFLTSNSDNPNLERNHMETS